MCYSSLPADALQSCVTTLCHTLNIERFSRRSLEVYIEPDKCPYISDSGRLTILKETARSQERLVLRATNTHQTMSRWLLFAKNCESSQTNRLYYLQFLIFVQLKFVLEKLKMQVTSASADFAITNSDRSTELTESFLLVHRYLDFDNG